MTDEMKKVIGKMSLQNGTIEIRYGTSFVGHYYIPIESGDGIKRKHVKTTIGRKGAMTKTQAREELRKIIRKHFAQMGAAPTGERRTFSLKEFVEERYYPAHAGQWRGNSKDGDHRSTSKNNRDMISKHILKQFGGRDIATIEKHELQEHLDRLRDDGYSHSLVTHVYGFLKSIFDEALEQNKIARDPARKLKVPANLRKPNHYFLPNWGAVNQVLAALPKRYRLFVEVAAQCAARPSELFALRRRSFDGEKFVISETFVRGELRPYAKTDKRCDLPVALPRELAKKLSAYLQDNPAPGDAFIFSSRNGTPFDHSSLLHDIIRPVKTQLKLPILNFQVLRRTWATLSDPDRKHIEVVKAQLGHTEKSNTAERVYIQPIPAKQQELLDRAYSDMQKAAVN